MGFKIQQVHEQHQFIIPNDEMLSELTLIYIN